MGLGNLFKSILGKSDVFARFEIEREAISGTMSKFYRVRDRKSHELFGLKILDKKQTELLEQRIKGAKKPPEGEIAMALQHERIVKTFEHGVTPKGEQYLVMEFVEGPGLNSLIIGKDPKLDGRRLELLRQAAESIRAVHEAGYIHRDICPRNFVVRKDLSALTLIDFGLTVPAKPEFMRPGNRTGTPSYMSPEVVRRRPTDHRLDIFSFGVTAYEVCALQHPWGAGIDGQAALAHDTQAPIPIEQLRPQIDPILGKSIMRCLAADPDQRPQSMDEFLTAIRAVQHEDRQG
jgi:serine/threonine-protein kinase